MCASARTYSPTRCLIVAASQTLVRRVIVRVERHASLDVLMYESGQRLSRFPTERTSDNLAVELPCTHDRRLPCGSAAGMHLFALMPVFLQTAHIGLVNFDRAGKNRCSACGEFPHPLDKKPGGFLRHAEFAVNLHTRNALQIRCRHVDRDGPLPQRDLAGFHRRSLTYGEVLPAVAAPAIHGLVRRRFSVN